MSALRRLYRGETNIDFIGYRKRWYLASAVIILVCLGSIIFRHFNFGIEFEGGSQYIADVKPGTSVEQVRGAVEAKGITVESATIRGSGDQRKYVIRTPFLNNDRSAEAVTAIKAAAHVNDVPASTVSSSWGKAVTQKALIGLFVFLVVVCAYIWIRFEQKMAYAALAALGHDLLLTAGVYSLIGFEVTPGTIIGLLTILGFSLYDTVVVFDKVDENARGLLGSSRYTYGEAANLAVNQTLMRSINTSLIGLLPVAGLLFVGAFLLGVGTLKDLALVLFVGMLTGAYSSLFLATPWLVDFKMLDQRYKLHAQRVLGKRAQEQGKPTKLAGKSTRAKATAAAESEAEDAEAEDAKPRVDALATSSSPRVGAKPTGGKPPQRKRPGAGGRPGGKRR
jgi:preprotein translocase subunit SecF